MIFCKLCSYVVPSVLSTVVANDTDLGSSTLTVMFPEGSSDQILCVDIGIVNDLLLEGEHDFNLTIVSAGSPPHAMINTDSSVTTITILDDERKLLFLLCG